MARRATSRLLARTYLPMARASNACPRRSAAREKPRLPLFAGIASALLNTVLNDLSLIFRNASLCRHGLFPRKGIATVAFPVGQFPADAPVFAGRRRRFPRRTAGTTPPCAGADGRYRLSLLPLLICEVTWSLGENVYAAIYGRMGTDASAAMTLTAPIKEAAR